MFNFFRVLLEKLEDTRHPGHYTAAKVSDSTTAELKQWCTDNNIPTSDDFFDNLHITICYSTKLFPIDEEAVLSDVSSWKVTPSAFDQFGKDPDKKYLVIKVKCPQATKRWQHYIDQGASYDFDEYTPHVTIAQNFTGDISKLDIGSLPNIVLSTEYYEKLS